MKINIYVPHNYFPWVTEKGLYVGNLFFPGKVTRTNFPEEKYPKNKEKNDRGSMTQEITQ